MSNSGHEPASSGAAASSFAHIGSDDQMDDADGEQALILEGADGETEHLQERQQGQVRVQGQQRSDGGRGEPGGILARESRDDMRGCGAESKEDEGPESMEKVDHDDPQIHGSSIDHSSGTKQQGSAGPQKGERTWADLIAFGRELCDRIAVRPAGEGHGLHSETTVSSGGYQNCVVQVRTLQSVDQFDRFGVSGTRVLDEEAPSIEEKQRIDKNGATYESWDEDICVEESQGTTSAVGARSSNVSAPSHVGGSASESWTHRDNQVSGLRSGVQAGLYSRSGSQDSPGAPDSRFRLTRDSQVVSLEIPRSSHS